MFRTILFFTAMWLPVIIFSPIALIYILLVKLNIGSWLEGFIHHGASSWAKLVLKTTGSTIKIEGINNIPPEKGLCFISNHQSAVDILIVLAALPMTVGFIAKKQLIYYPFLNIWIIALRSVFIDRGSVKKAMRSIDRGVEFIKKGNSMIIFPEGTRSKSDRIGTFKNGSIKLATRAEATIVPLTIKGSWHVWEENHKIAPANIKFSIHPPIPTKGLQPEEKKALNIELFETIKKVLS